MFNNNRLTRVLRNKENRQNNQVILTEKDKSIFIKKAKKIINIFLIIIISVSIFLYVPVIFWPSSENSKLTVNDTTETIKKIIKDNSNKDFDNDGINNKKEMEYNSNIYYVDTDRDGLGDNLEIEQIKSSPCKKNNIQEGYTLPEGVAVNTPFSQNGIILWADDLYSRVCGSVTNTVYGQYRFINFRGWVQFPHKIAFAYKLKNKVRTALNYREQENVYYIDEDCIVEIRDQKIEMINYFNLFGKEIYAHQNFLTNILAGILPDNKGFLQGQTISRLDFIPDTNLNGEFEIQDYNDPNNFVKVKIIENTSSYVNEKNKTVQLNTFDFEGGGYSSYNGDCINFLASSTKTS